MHLPMSGLDGWGQSSLPDLLVRTCRRRVRGRLGPVVPIKNIFIDADCPGRALRSVPLWQVD